MRCTRYGYAIQYYEIIDTRAEQDDDNIDVHDDKGSLQLGFFEKLGLLDQPAWPELIFVTSKIIITRVKVHVVDVF